jgi:hypothetical protein
MTIEQVKKGNELKTAIDKTRSLLEKWINAERFFCDTICVKSFEMKEPSGGGDPYKNSGDWNVSYSPETFLVVKALNVQYYTNQLADLERQLSEV